MKKYIISFIPFPNGNEKVYFEFETIACPGTFSFWYHVYCSFSGTIEKLEWVDF